MSSRPGGPSASLRPPAIGRHALTRSRVEQADRRGIDLQAGLRADRQGLPAGRNGDVDLRAARDLYAVFDFRAEEEYRLDLAGNSLLHRHQLDIMRARCQGDLASLA